MTGGIIVKKVMKKYRHSLNLQTFNDGETVPEVPTGVEEVPAAEEQPIETTQTEDKADAAFAKRLAASLSAKEKEWEEKKQAELQALKDQYKDYDTYKKATEYLQKTSGISDIMTLKEEIEMQELQERAEKENLPADVLKRLDELEAKAKRADELEAQTQQAKEIEEFEKSIREFCKDKTIDGEAVDHEKLWSFMAEHQIGNPEIAFKAMKADILENKLAEAKKAGVQEYLESKKGVKTGGGAPTGSDAPPKSLEEAEKRAIARLKSLREG